MQWNQQQMMISTKGNDVNIIGPTIVTPNFRFFDSMKKTLQYFRGIGWMPNNGQGHLEPGAQELGCSVRSYDDIVKAAQNVVTRRMVIWQGKNGGSFQFGWYGYDVQEAVKCYD